jgi:hypothetical protein
MRGSHVCYSLLVIVISEALVLQHGRLAKNTVHIIRNRRKVQLKMNENNGGNKGKDYFW